MRTPIVLCACAFLAGSSRANADENNPARLRLLDVERVAVPVAPATSLGASAKFGYRSVESLRNGSLEIELRGRFLLAPNVALGAHLAARGDYTRGTHSELLLFGASPAGLFVEIGGGSDEHAWSMSLDGDLGPRLFDATNLDTGSPRWSAQMRVQYARHANGLVGWVRGRAGVAERGALSIQFGSTIGFAIQRESAAMPALELEALGATDLALAWRVHASLRIAAGIGSTVRDSLLLRLSVGFPGDPEGLVGGITIGLAAFE